MYLPDFVSGWDKRIFESGRTYLYIIESASIPNRIKIGIAKDPLKRLTAIDGGRYSLPLPYELKYLFLLADAHAIEKCVQIHLWKQGRWHYGELFNCPADEAAAVVRAILADYDKFRKIRSLNQVVTMLEGLKMSDETKCAFSVSTTDPIFEKAVRRYTRSAIKKAKLTGDGWDGFYKIEQHRSWYQKSAVDKAPN